MKGLLKKDFCLLLQNRMALLTPLLICVFMSFSLDASFLAGYVVMFFGILGLGTVAYDQADNGMAFLLTLPASRRTYVREKFLFCLLLELVGLLFGLAVYAVEGLLHKQGPEMLSGLPYVAAVLPLMFLMVSVMLAVEIKFGADKSRTVMLAIYGGVAAIAILVSQIKDSLGGFVDSLAGFFLSIPSALLVSGSFALVALVCFLLYRFALKALEQKDL